ncbi:hypothetical protein QVD17_31227 [Tagetes erecta]|uniref:Uncharacterized protein n=1 Tax=Tagetes erecta TaxID=13708 RepID=A0AAD8K5U8_TARER|nr:hypothetical protein QVD17_31227 [Tagetes erecta]
MRRVATEKTNERVNEGGVSCVMKNNEMWVNNGRVNSVTCIAGDDLYHSATVSLHQSKPPIISPSHY